MTQETIYRSLNGKDFDRPDLALLEDFHVLRHLLAVEVDSLIVCGHAPLRYEEQVKHLREHFKRCVEAGRVYIAEYQEFIKGDTAPHQKAVIDLQKQAQAVKNELAPVHIEKVA